MKCLAIAKKDIMMYYLKGPVVIFGILLPLFLFLAFWIGRELPLNFLMAGLISMTVFFASTSVSPVIAPWEGQMRTLLACPVSTSTIIFGDIIASLSFGICISLIPLLLAFCFGFTPNHNSCNTSGCLLLLLPGLAVLSLSDKPALDGHDDLIACSLSANIHKRNFHPCSGASSLGKGCFNAFSSHVFPDVARASFGMESFLSVYMDFIALLIFSVIFLILAIKLHERALLSRIF